jgi:hypothetical protein
MGYLSYIYITSILHLSYIYIMMVISYRKNGIWKKEKMKKLQLFKTKRTNGDLSKQDKWDITIRKGEYKKGTNKIYDIEIRDLLVQLKTNRVRNWKWWSLLIQVDENKLNSYIVIPKDYTVDDKTIHFSLWLRVYYPRIMFAYWIKSTPFVVCKWC